MTEEAAVYRGHGESPAAEARRKAEERRAVESPVDLSSVASGLKLRAIGSRFDVLEAAIEAVKRGEAAYGPPTRHFERAAALCSVLLGVDISAHQVALCLIGLKLARLIEAPEHEDSAIDLAGYAGILHQLAAAELDEIETKRRAREQDLRERAGLPGT